MSCWISDDICVMYSTNSDDIHTDRRYSVLQYSLTGWHLNKYYLLTYCFWRHWYISLALNRSVRLETADDRVVNGSRLERRACCLHCPESVSSEFHRSSLVLSVTASDIHITIIIIIVTTTTARCNNLQFTALAATKNWPFLCNTPIQHIKNLSLKWQAEINRRPLNNSWV